MKIKKVVKKLVDKFRSHTSEFDGRILPAPYLRLCGDYFKDDKNFLESATKEADRLIKEFDLTSEKILLDLGCGYGRLAIGVREKLPSIRKFYGIDVNKDAISWCARYIGQSNKNFVFIHTDVENSRYNPDGSVRNIGLSLPIPDASVDLVYLYSVFSHMLSDDVSIYLKEFHRMIKGQGKVFLTAFVEEDVEDVVENPENYLSHHWNGPLHCVRYNKLFFDTMIKSCGFRILDFSYATETHGQSNYKLAKN